MPTSTPVQFEPDLLHRSVDRMMALAPERIFVTHYGELGPVAPLAAVEPGRPRLQPGDVKPLIAERRG